MKRSLVFLLIIALAVPAAASALTGSSPFFGHWVAREHQKIARYDAVLHYVFIHENSPCSYMKFNLMHGGLLSGAKAEPEELFGSNWEAVDDYIKIPTSGISYIELYYDSTNDTLYCNDPKLTFVRLP